MSKARVSVPEPARGGWITSSYSNTGGSCVEVKFATGATWIRDSKDPAGQPHLGFPAAGWSSFLNAIND